MGMARRRRESESAARTRHVHGGRGEDKQQCKEEVIDKRRRWMELGLEYNDYCTYVY